MSIANPVTLLDIVKKSTTYLTGKSDSPRLDAEILIAHSLGIERIDVYLQFDRPMDEAILAPIREALRRRVAGEPVAYIVGQKEFYGRMFSVSRDVLIPRPETELIIEGALAWVKAHAVAAPNLLDVATGSGCIACTLAAELPESTGVAIDISESAIALAAANARTLGVDARIAFRTGSWTDPVAPAEKFDIITANPPYIATGELDDLPLGVRDFEPRGALDGGVDGLQPYEQLAPGLSAHFRRPGILLLEVDPERAGAVAEIVRKELPAATITICKDLSGRDRIVEAVLE